jgi:hypothetical protein
VAIPDGAVQVHPGAGEAELHVADLPIEDYFNLPNALRDGPEVDATVSFDVVWSGPVTRQVSVTNGTNGDQFAGQFEEDQATVTWSGSNELGFSFHSNPGDFSTSAPGRAFAEVGHEENGTFFGEGDGGAASLAQAAGTQAPPGASSALDQAFAAFGQGGTGLGPSIAPATSHPETGFAGGPATGATAVGTTPPQAADPATGGPALFTAVGRPIEDALSR